MSDTRSHKTIFCCYLATLNDLNSLLTIMPPGRTVAISKSKDYPTLWLANVEIGEEE